MNGALGGGAGTIKPEQFNVLNPLLILIFIPLSDKVIYPCLERQGFFLLFLTFLFMINFVILCLCCRRGILRTPLQKVCTGGYLAIIAFICAAILESNLQKTYAVVPTESEAHINLINALPCTVGVDYQLGETSNSIELAARLDRTLPSVLS